MNKLFHIEGDLRIFLLLTLWSVIVLLLMSMDSPLHHIYMRVDSAWFFMEGKAMMNGMRPYVDFTDSKGPLLWLIYGIGYLLSPRNYVGVYVLSCLCYGGILYYNYKTAKLLLGDDRRSLLVALLMPWFYFLYWFHNEIRAEDFSTLYVSSSLYYLFQLLYGETGKGGELPRTAIIRGLVMGVSFVALMLIKWNLAVMQGIMIVIAFWYYVCENSRKAPSFLNGVIIGALALFLPFFFYLLIMGSFTAFIQEYFINTVLTINTPHGIPQTYQEDLLKAWGTPSNQFVLLVIVFGGWLLSRLLSSYRYIPLLVGIFFYAIASKHNFYYYLTICNIFFIYVLIYLVSLVGRPLKVLYLGIAAIAVISWGIFDNSREGSQLHAVAKWSGGENQKDYEEALSITKAMSGYHKPRILNLFYFELGFEVPHEGLPAGKYFAWQNGMTPEMEAGHVEILKSGKADFVIVGDEKICESKGYTKDLIESFGYKQILVSEYNSEAKFRKTVAVYKNKNMNRNK